MGEAIGQTLTMVVGVALSPVPIIAVILMLFTPRARANGSLFVVGWLVGLLVSGGILLAIGSATTDDAASTTSGWVKLLLGVLLIGLAFKNWRHRPRGDEQPALPGWMSAIDSFTAPKATGLGVLLSGVNPKNLALTAAAVAVVSGLGLSSTEEVSWLVVYAVLASVTVATPVVVSIAMGDRASEMLTSWKEWLGRNNAVVMAVLLLVIGVKIAGDGISILLA